MYFIGKHRSLIGILLLAVFVGAAAGLYFDVPKRFQKARAKRIASQEYTCPMHSDVVSAKLGKCPKCGMALTLASASRSAHDGGTATAETEPHGCCAKPQPAELKLPPGHPPIHDWPTNARPESQPASSAIPAHSSH